MTDFAAWSPRPRPDGRTLAGRYVRLEKLDPQRHGAELGAELTGPKAVALFTYLFDLPPVEPAEVQSWAVQATTSQDPLYYAVVDQTSGRALGRLSLMRMEPTHGVIEVGHILYGLSLQRRPGATETQYILMRHVFDDLGYRRYEWKCNALNAPSRRAAERLGFSFEGIFRQHMVVKGSNRDTAWYSLLDSEWPACKAVFEAWLEPTNFDAQGVQIERLAAIRQRNRASGRSS